MNEWVRPLFLSNFQRLHNRQRLALGIKTIFATLAARAGGSVTPHTRRAAEGIDSAPAGRHRGRIRTTIGGGYDTIVLLGGYDRVHRIGEGSTPQYRRQARAVHCHGTIKDIPRYALTSGG